MVLSKIETMRDLNTPAVKLHNWNVVSENLKLLDIPEIDSELKSLIVSGDIEMVNEIIKDIFDTF